MNQSVVIVDDSLTVRMDLVEAFRAAGFRTVPCATAAAARDAFARKRASIYVVDMLLPDGDGLELVKEIRRSPAGALIVVVLISSGAEARDRIRGLQSGADAYISKPYDTSYLIAKARELLHARQPLAYNDTSILVIDDSLTFREQLRETLESGGFRVLTASSGEAGLRMAGAQRPDIILVDGVLPGIDGATVIRRTRLDAALRDVLCVLMTASEDTRAEFLALEAGADTFIRKDEDVDVVLAKLSAALRRRTPRASGGEETRSLLGPRKVLVVADSLTYLESLTGALQADGGYDVVSARSGEEAFDLLAVESVDCILLDLTIPGLSGDETCRRIKAAPAVRNVPLIMLGAVRDREAMIRGLGAGADDYVLKTDAVETLTARVHAQVRRKQFEDENRRIREELLRRQVEAAGERAAREVAETRAALLEQLERSNGRAERLKADEERMEFALTAAQVGIWQRDLVTGEVVVSKSMGAVLGVPSGGFRGTLDDIYAGIHPDDRATVWTTIEEVVHRGGDFSVEYRSEGLDGRTRWFQSRGRTAHDRHGRADRLLGVTIDVTERRSLELQLHQSQKMEAVGQLAGGVAHDFNNVLTAILGHAGFLLEDLTEESQRHDVEQIVKAGNRAAGFTKQLLSFSRRQVVETAVLDLDVVIAEIAPMLRQLIGEQIELETVPDLQLFPVRADRGHLEQVILNLVVNARDAMPHGGTIRLRTANVVVDEPFSTGTDRIPAGSYVRISVTDTGCGMSDLTRARLFEPFFTTKDRSKGTGLGLATVYGIVRQSGGHLAVRSELNRGSTFEVWLPKTIGPLAVQKSLPTSRPAGGDETILLVEDQADVRDLTHIFLERAGYHVVDAVNPAHAESIFSSMTRRVDLLVTDVVMPGGTGPELFARLVERSPQLRVLFMSGYTDTAALDLAALEREAGFLQKPFMADDMIHKVRQVLDR